MRNSCCETAPTACIHANGSSACAWPPFAPPQAQPRQHTAGLPDGGLRGIRCGIRCAGSNSPPPPWTPPAAYQGNRPRAYERVVRFFRARSSRSLPLAQTVTRSRPAGGWRGLPPTATSAVARLQTRHGNATLRTPLTLQGARPAAPPPAQAQHGGDRPRACGPVCVHRQLVPQPDGRGVGAPPAPARRLGVRGRRAGYGRESHRGAGDARGGRGHCSPLPQDPGHRGGGAPVPRGRDAVRPCGGGVPTRDRGGRRAPRPLR
jgi:hypothetical protein